MKLRIMSDLHLEFSDFNIPDQDGDKDTVLILAGDIGLVHKTNLQLRFLPLLSRCNVQFRKTILICGNHEHYGGNFRKTVSDLRKAIADQHLYNVILLEKELTVIDDVAFIGATLWTDCDKGRNPNDLYLFSGMSDSHVIRNGGDGERKFTVQDTKLDHEAARSFILKSIDEQTALGHKTVVVVHHGVTAKSIHAEYAGSQMNMFFASEMTEDWLQHEPSLIVHGHTHKQMDYFVQDDKVRVVVNPQGYVGREDTSGFDPLLTIETDDLCLPKGDLYKEQTS